MSILTEIKPSSNGVPLPVSPSQLAGLEARGLSHETIRKAGLTRISDPEQLANVLKWKPCKTKTADKPVSGILIPFPGCLGYARVRHDVPRVNKKGESIRYDSPMKEGNRAYIPQGVEGILQDTSIPLVLTEGEFKALVLWQWLIHAIALVGVYGWMKARKKDADGQGIGPREFIDDLEKINWNGRLVFIVFDSDAAEKDQVQLAEKHLAHALATKGATVRIVRIPPGPNGTKMGADDFIVANGIDAFRQLLTKAEDGKQAKKKRESDATKMANAARDAVELFHDDDGDPFITFSIDGHKETHALKSKGARQFLRRFFYLKFKRNIGSQAFQDAFGLIESMAIFDGERHAVHTRVAECEQGIVIDLCDSKWRCVIITESGWTVAAESPVKFRRPAAMMPLPVPEPGGSITDLQKHVNYGTEADWKFLVAWILSAFWPRGPYPILALHGEQGSAKSTLAKLLKALIDPNKAPIRKSPRDEEDLVIAASNSRLLAFDNLSHLQDWQSDAHCRLATGGGIGKRLLYSDGDEFILDVVRPQVINGIEELATRGDLQERCITLNLPTITEEKRRTERDLWAAFRADLPKILGAIFKILGDAKLRLSSVKLETHPRMADFAELVTAAEKALGWNDGDFIAVYADNATDSNCITLEASPITEPLRQVIQSVAFDGTHTELLDRLEAVAGEKAVKKKNWPGNSRSLSAIIKRLAPALRKAGITVTAYKGEKPKRERRVTIEMTLEREGKSASSASLTSTLPINTERFGGTQDGRGGANSSGGTQTHSVRNAGKSAQGTQGDVGDVKPPDSSNHQCESDCERGFV